MEGKAGDVLVTSDVRGASGVTTHATLLPDEPLPAGASSATTREGLQVLLVQVGPVVLELHDRAALYALEELVQLALEQAAELWLECRACQVRDSLVTQERDGIAHPYCRDELAGRHLPPRQLRLV